MTTQQPEALRREYRATMPHEILHLWAVDALACIASLEAQLEAIGAGGVNGPLIGQPQAAESVPAVDQSVMELAESVGLIGPTSRIGDLHAAIQRFHDLICVNATIKAATMAAEVISSVAMPDLQDAVLLLRKYRRLCQEVGRGDSAHLDRIEAAAVAVQTVAARAPAESVGQDALNRLLKAAAEMVETVECYDPNTLLALDEDPHPPSTINASSDRLQRAIVSIRAAMAANGGNK